MSDTEIITDETGRVTAIVINNTRYSPEAIAMLQTNTINLADHEEALRLWKEAASNAINSYEDERRKRIEVEGRLATLRRGLSATLDAAARKVEDAEQIADRYAARVADADQVLIVTSAVYEVLVRAVRMLDELRLRNGRQTS